MFRQFKGGSTTYVRGELLKQFSIIAFIILIAIWQQHFVIQAASADVYIFALLFSAGIFGVYSTVRGTFNLGKDFVALDAIRELHDDTRRKLHAPEDHAIIVAKRNEQPPVIYDPPKSLGTAHNLIMEEMLRTGTLRISPQIMQVLAHDLESKLDGRREMSHYLGAMMVLLGLLGTFIGLMHTLESVGGILGSLDLSGSAGNGAIAGLIESLKRPLEGMAVGFGASLFGLIGSLLTGVLSRVDSNASNRLAHEFESWIRSVVQIDTSQSKSDEGESLAGSAIEPNAKNWRMIFQVARSTVQSTAKMAEQIVVLSSSIQTLRDGMESGSRDLRQDIAKLAVDLQRLAAVQSSTGAGVDHLRHGVSDAYQRTVAKLAEISAVLDASAIQNVGVANRIETELENLSAISFVSREYASENNALLRTIDEKIQAVRTAHESGLHVNSVQAETRVLVAQLDHLIATTRLAPEDADRLQRLAALMGSEMPKADPSQAQQSFPTAAGGDSK